VNQGYGGFGTTKHGTYYLHGNSPTMKPTLE